LHPLHVQPESPGDELVAMPLDPLNNINQATHISVALSARGAFPQSLEPAGKYTCTWISH